MSEVGNRLAVANIGDRTFQHRTTVTGGIALPNNFTCHNYFRSPTLYRKLGTSIYSMPWTACRLPGLFGSTTRATRQQGQWKSPENLVIGVDDKAFAMNKISFMAIAALTVAGAADTHQRLAIDEFVALVIDRWNHHLEILAPLEETTFEVGSIARTGHHVTEACDRVIARFKTEAGQIISA